MIICTLIQWSLSLNMLKDTHIIQWSLSLKDTHRCVLALEVPLIKHVKGHAHNTVVPLIKHVKGHAHNTVVPLIKHVKGHSQMSPRLGGAFHWKEISMLN